MKGRTLSEQYVDTAASMQGLALTADQRERVIDTFEMNLAIISPLLDYALPMETEAAPVYKA
ncbi:MAG: 1-carboxybiuret hydrolase subunit AtzG-like [Burkholderiales bacterium]|jgi:hypothetical protein|nr:hypothetical protein [Herminiimonas sp.]